MRAHSRLGALFLTFLAFPALLQAQTFSLGASRMLASGRPTLFSLGAGTARHGPFMFSVTGQYLSRAGTPREWWAGVGGEAIVRTTPDAAPYLVFGGGLGMGQDVTVSGDMVSTGTSLSGILSAGAGAEFLTIGGVGAALEARYSRLGIPRTNGITLGIRIGSRISRRNVGPEPLKPGEVPRANPSDEEAIRLATAAGASPPPAGASGARAAAANVVVTAIGAMGTPYRWGGTGDNGFDCSGLIQYSYAKWGIVVPRRSVEQARAGHEVPRYIESLLAGDILTFADQPGGNVTHVGLYVGNGRFIHSARNGVQVSVLSADDSVGRWWWDRWLGARRVVDQ